MIIAYRPALQDLWFRQQFMADEETMSYNHAFGGTIPFPESEWEEWYDHWLIHHDHKRFYRYLLDPETQSFVGEIAYHYDEERKIWLADVIVASAYRNKGYGSEGLQLLCEIAEENGIDVLRDDIAVDNPAARLFLKAGFTEEYRTDEIIMLKKDMGGSSNRGGLINMDHTDRPDGYNESIQKGIRASAMLREGLVRGEADRTAAIGRLREALGAADAVVIGAGAGLSTAAGFAYSGERFERYFSDFAAQYHFSDMYAGGFYPYAEPEETWAFWSRYIYINRFMAAPKPVYSELLDLVKNKDYFVITTNVDHQFQKAGFDKERLFYTQGDYGLWQCSKPCHMRTYDNKDKVVRMVLAQGFMIGADGELLVPETDSGTTDFGSLAMRVPSDLVPYCPVCGEPMAMNLRSDETFVEDEGWHAASAAYADFLGRHTGGRTLYLELGAGFNTPVIIKYPFWQMTKESEGTVYACINMNEAFAPVGIADRSICIDGDIGEILKELRELLQ